MFIFYVFEICEVKKMKNRRILQFLCVILALVTFVSASVLVSADTTAAETEQSEITGGTSTAAADTTTADTTSASSTTGADTEAPAPSTSAYSLKFLTGTKKEHNMTLNGGSYTCKLGITVDNPELLVFSINKDGRAVGGVEFLLYKAKTGAVTFTYNEAAGLSISGDKEDVVDTFDFETQQYLVTVDGGKLEDLPGKFKGKNISSFYYAAGDNVVISATVDDDKQFKSWTCNQTLIKLDNKETVEFTLPKKSGYNIEIKASFEMKAQSFGEMLKEYKNVTLEENYTIDETIKLTSGEYTINLDGYDLKSSTIAFELNGASLTIEGEGSITCSGSTAILLKTGSLVIEGGTIAGKTCAIDARGGQLTIMEGVIEGGTQSALSIASPCEVMINGGTFNLSGSKPALSVTGGKVAISGGTYYGSVAIQDWNAKRDITVYSGSFVTDVSKYIATGSSTEQVGGMYTVKIEDPKYNLNVFGGTGGGMYKAGERVTITANGEDDISQFDEWIILSGTVSITDKKSKTITFFMPECDLVIKAAFVIVDTGIETEVITAPETTAPVTETEEESETEELLPETVVTTEKENEEHGSFALIILVIVLCALLVAAIAVSVIIIVRKYNIEKEAQERAQLGRDVVDSLADQLSELDFGDVAAAAGGAAAMSDDEATPETEEGAVDSSEEDMLNADEPQMNSRPREMRRLRKVPTANFEPEDLTVTKERDVETSEDPDQE